MLDVGSEPAIRTVIAEIADRHGKIDIVVANAGIDIRRSAAECSLKEWNAVVQINLNGVFLSARTTAEHMPNAGGAVVSTAAIMSFSGGGLYPAFSYTAT